MAPRAAEANPLKQLSVRVLKGKVDLLQEDDGHFPTLEAHFKSATEPSADRPHGTLVPAQYNLQHALFKRLNTLARSGAANVRKESASLLTAERQSLVVGKVVLALNDSNKEFFRAAWEALQSYAALAGAYATDGESGALLHAGRELFSTAYRSNKGVYQTLAFLLPSFSTEDVAQWSPALPVTLLAGMGTADNISFRGALLGAVYVKMYADRSAQALEWQWEHAAGVLAKHLKECDAAVRFNLVQFAVRPLAEEHAEALLDLIRRVEAGAATAGAGGEEAWIALVSLGTALSLCIDISLDTPSGPDGKTHIPVSVERLEALLAHPSPVVRLGVYRLVTDKPAVGAHVTKGEWFIVETFLKSSMNVYDSDARSNIIARTSHFLRRLKNSTCSSHRQLLTLRGKTADGRNDAENARISELKLYVHRSEVMLNWIVDHCFANLLIGGSYPRSYVSLRLLSVLIASSAFLDYPQLPADVHTLPGLKDASDSSRRSTADKADIRWPSPEALFADDERGRARVLKVVRCLKSSFADVRVCALSILEQAVISIPGLGDAASIEALYKEALEYVSNPRGSESTTGALLLRLVYTLKAKETGSTAAGDSFVAHVLAEITRRLDLAREDVIKAASTQPVHGLFSALQQILPLLPSNTSDISVFTTALRVIVRAWEGTRPILSSAEAGGASGEDDVDHEEARAAKIVSAQGEAGGRREREMLLSWAWRTMRESSVLLAIVARRLLQSPSADVELAQEIGGLFIAFLSEIRHPGAFLSIYPQYTEVVSVINKSASLPEDVKALPSAWLQTHLTTVSGFHKTSGRRSAGLPYAILGAVLGQPKLGASAFAALFDLADDGQEETTRIAAINTLKVLCTNAKLAQDLARVYERAVTVAMHSLSSPSWGVRNVGLQLMGALVKKGFGRNSDSADQEFLNIWFSKYPTLHGLFLQSLEAITQEELDSSPGSAFVILQFLRCLKASPSDTGLQDAFLSHIDRFARCKQIDIRLAAAAATPAVIPTTAIGSFVYTADLLSPPSSQNALHGKLSQILTLLQTSVHSLSYSSGGGIVDYICQAQGPLLERNPCGPTQALFIRVVQAVREKTGSALPAHVFAPTDEFCQRQVQGTADSQAAPGADALNLAAARYIIALHDPSALLSSPNEEVVEIALAAPAFTTAPLEARMQIAGLATATEKGVRARMEALGWAQRYSQTDFTKVPPSRWDRLLAEYEDSRNQPLRQALLTVLGKAIGQCASQDRVEKLLMHLDKASHESQSVESRLSAMASLTAFAPTLSAFAPSAPALSVTYRLLVLRLLMDDDADVRRAACSLVSRLTDGAERAGLAHEVAVERWMRESGKACGPLKEWREALWTALAEGLGEQAQADEPATFVLFAAEPDNAFREAELELSRLRTPLAHALLAAPPADLGPLHAQLQRCVGAHRRSRAGVQAAGARVLPGEKDDARALRKLRIEALAAALGAATEGGEGGAAALVV